MSRKSRFQDMREAKDKRMKRMAIGGFVVLAAVLAFEIPHVMKRGGASSSSPAATTTATDTTASATSTPTGTPVVSATPTAPTQLPNSDPTPSRSKSQLFSFTHFAGKDPFVQQLSDSSGASATAITGGSAPSGSAPSGSAPSGSTGTAAAPAQVTAARTLATSGTARISVNGRVQLVRVGKSFPSANPLFRLISVSHGVVRIGIANGSYSSGAQTVSLAAGRTLTLVDTADGIRYKIRLLSAA
jgi:hypothetical protein